MENNNNIPEQFNLPGDYFNSSKTNILNKIEWLSEHEVYPLLTHLKGRHGFVVPENYFETNSSTLELIGFPKLNSISKQNTFETPAHYFEQFKTAILNKIEHDSELDELPLLSKLMDTYPLNVSETYFTDSKKRIQAANTGNGGAKIISLNRKALWYAAAAVLTITFGLWIYNSLFNTPVVIDETCNTLACIEKRELLKYKLDNLDNDELFEMVNTEQLQKNLNKIENTDSLSKNDSTDSSLMDYIE